MYFEAVLFWVFVGFFVLIGVSSILVEIGLIPSADPAFRKWALGGFLAAVVTAVVGVFRFFFLTPDLYVSFLPPADQFDLTAAMLGHEEAGDTKWDPAVLAMQPGGWEVTVPSHLLAKVVRLQVQDRDGKRWIAKPFFPNHRTVQMELSPPQATESFHLPLEPRTVMAAGVTLGEAAEAAGKNNAPEELKFGNYARETSVVGKRQFYQWRVFVDEPRPVLERISEVEYVLHPSFPDPVHVAKDATKQFELIAYGWGEFDIRITVRFKDGGHLKTTYYLDLTKRWPPPKPDS